MDRIIVKADLHVDEKANTVEGIAWPYATPDKVGDIIVKGAITPAVAELPMLLEHKTGQLIGLWTQIEDRADGLYVKGQFNETVLARGVRSQIITGRRNGLSIAFYTKAAKRQGKNRIISNLDLVEVSVVERPSHPGAQLTHVKNMTVAHAIAEAINRSAMALEVKFQRAPHRFIVEPDDFEEVEVNSKSFDEASHPRAPDGKWIGAGLSKGEVAAMAPNFWKVPRALRADARSSMQSWVGDEYVYKKINDALRERSNHTTAAAQKLINGLDTVFKHSARALTQDTILYRGLSTRTAFEVGKEYLDRGFQSTSSSRSIANAFTPDGGGTLLSIVARAGTQVVAPSGRDGKNLESEVLLNRGTRLRILKVAGKNVHAEVVRGGERSAPLKLAGLAEIINRATAALKLR